MSNIWKGIYSRKPAARVLGGHATLLFLLTFGLFLFPVAGIIESATRCESYTLRSEARKYSFNQEVCLEFIL